MKISKEEVKAFFDKCASDWDAQMIRNDEIIDKILDGAGVKDGVRVLDVACGTGVLFPDYLKRNVGSVVGIDLSPKMIEIAKKKFLAERKISLVCGDVMELESLQMLEKEQKLQFDCIMIYNAFPHFPNQREVISYLSDLLSPGGTLTVAHGWGRKKIDSHHKNHADRISVGVMHEDELERIMAEKLSPIIKISDEYMYQVTARAKI